MGAWGPGLYSGDFAGDLKTTIAAVCRLPLDDEALVEAVCQSERFVAADATNPDHTVFWLVLADQFEKRGIFSPRVRQTALAIIDSGNDTAAMRALGMKPADMRKRMVQLAALRARLLAQPQALRERKTIKEPEPYVFELHGVYAYPTRGGSAINPYMPAKRFDRAARSPDGFGLMLIVGRGRAFGYLAWYSAVKVAEIVPTVPEGDALALGIRWAAPPFYGTCNRAHFRKLELREVGIDSRAYTCAGLHAQIATQGFVYIGSPFQGFAVSDVYFCSGSNRLEPRGVATRDNLQCPIPFVKISPIKMVGSDVEPDGSRARQSSLPVVAVARACSSPPPIAIYKASALWTQSCRDGQIRAAKRSFPDDDYRFPGPCLRGEHAATALAQRAELARSRHRRRDGRGDG